ncbi:ATP-binding protein [Jeotgalibacillus soli]
MAGKLDQLEKLCYELLAGITHDLKTPVTSISGLLQAVKDDVVKEDEAQEFLAIALKETDRLKLMIQSLLDFEILNAGSILLRKERIDLVSFIQEMIYRWRAAHQEAEGNITVEAATVPHIVEADPIHLQQILLNVLNKARNASASGNHSIQFLLSKRDKSIEVAIIDHGHGVPNHEQVLIFERFYRGEKNKLRVRGLGLGLPFSRLLAREHGGDLELKETSEEGSTFLLTLPVEKEE